MTTLQIIVGCTLLLVLLNWYLTRFKECDQWIAFYVLLIVIWIWRG